MALHSIAPFGNGVSARVVSIAHGKVTGTGPGVMRGRAEVAFALSIHNGASHSIRLNTVQVTATYGASKSPAVPSDEQSSVFTGTLRPGGSARGRYAFAVPTNEQGDVTISISYAQGVPVVLLRGSAR